jgi:hypothetical protein
MAFCRRTSFFIARALSSDHFPALISDPFPDPGSHGYNNMGNTNRK